MRRVLPSRYRNPRGPLALLVEGQAWRWIWVVGFIGILLLPITVLSVWRDEKCGPFCAVMLIWDGRSPIARRRLCYR